MHNNREICNLLSPIIYPIHFLNRKAEAYGNNNTSRVCICEGVFPKILNFPKKYFHDNYDTVVHTETILLSA
jgi:hypothetical protein